MRPYTTKHDDDLRLGAPSSLPSDDASNAGSLREWLAVSNERLSHLSTTVRDLTGRVGFVDDQVTEVRRRLAVVEERLSHTATKSWILGCAMGVLAAGLGGTLGGFWWIVQQYVGPLMRASAG
jgi:hypothetical protein